MREIAATGRLVDGSLEGGDDLSLMGDGGNGVWTVLFYPDLRGVFVFDGHDLLFVRERV